MTDHKSTVDGECITELTSAVGQLIEEVRVLRMAIDELRDDLVHALRNGDSTNFSRFQRITSMPSDPLADDFGERLNAVPPETIEALREDVGASAEETSDAAPTDQKELF